MVVEISQFQLNHRGHRLFKSAKDNLRYLYLGLFFFLVLITASGLLLLNGVPSLGALGMLDLHRLGYTVTLYFTLLHLPAVFSHDLSGQGADISAMVNGYRIFHIGEIPGSNNPGEQTIPLDSLIKSLKK